MSTNRDLFEDYPGQYIRGPEDGGHVDDREVVDSDEPTADDEPSWCWGCGAPVGVAGCACDQED